MNDEVITYLIIGLVIGFIIGLIATSLFSGKIRQYNRLKKELETTKQELASQKQIIVKHFSHSAEILDNMANDFRRLYKHMAENSSHLLSAEDISKVTVPNAFIAQDENTAQSVETKEPPKDYSGQPSGLLKTEHHKESLR